MNELQQKELADKTYYRLRGDIRLLKGATKSSEDYRGKVIKAISMTEERLLIDFEDGIKIQVFDYGQNCCESRYMRTDDNIQDLVGKKLDYIAVKDAPEEVGQYGDVHEVQFLEIMTNDGFVTFSNHNEHNGYYGGFGLTIVEL